mgnify:FL=1
MGRAIDMEKDIDVLKKDVDYLRKVTRGLSMTMTEVEEIVFKEKKKTKETKTDGKKETNNEGNDKSSVKSNKRKTDAVSKNRKS